MTTEEIISLLEAEVDGIEPGTLSAETELTSVPAWDSLAVLVVIASVDYSFGVTLTGRELQACLTVQDIAQLVSSKK